jgi:hypothetical protein
MERVAEAGARRDDGAPISGGVAARWAAEGQDPLL